MRAFGLWVVVAIVGCSGENGSKPSDNCTGTSCACPADKLDCGDGCIDVANDPMNCGACGYSCGTASCSAGLCTAEPFALVANAPGDQLFVDGDDLVFATRGERTSSGTVFRVSRTDGAATPVYRGLSDYPSIAVRPDSTIVIADAGQAGGCDTEANAGVIAALSASGPRTISIGRRCVASLAATSTELAWIEDFPRIHFGGDMPKPAFAFLPSNAEPLDAPTRRPFTLDQPAVVVAHGETVMWIEEGSIMQRDGGATTTAVTTGVPLVALAFDDHDIAYAPNGGEVFVRSRTGGMAKSLGSGLKWTDSLQLDAHFVFVATETGLIVIDRESGEQRELAPSWFHAIAQDDQYVFGLRDVTRMGVTQTEVVRFHKPATPFLPAGPLTCKEPLEPCAFDSCIDTRSDVFNCGGCALQCPSSDVCEASQCVCADTSLVCNGTCIDPASDPDNCGACGRTCDGGTCVGGDCQPHKIANSAYAPIHDASAIYFATGHQLRRIDKATLADTLVAELPGFYDYPRDLAQDATKLYIAAGSGTSSGAIWTALKSGANAPTTLYSNREDPRHIAVVASGIVWIESDATVKSKLVYAAADGSGVLASFAPTNLYSGANDDETAGVAVVDSVVYWLLGDSSHSALLRIDLAAAQPAATLVTELALHPYSLAVAGTDLYISAGWPNGKILSMPLAGGPMTTHAQGLAYPSGLSASPEGGVWWIAGDYPSAIYEHAPGMAVPRIVQSGNDVRLQDIVLVDADRVFTASTNGLFVMRR